VVLKCYLNQETQQQKLKQGKLMTENKTSKEKIAQLQLLEQNLQTFLMQKQQFQLQLNETTSALEGIKTSSKSYKIISNVMIDAKKEDLEKELTSKKEMLEIRIKNLEKQENDIREKSQKIQKEVLNTMD
jgi:prefoldin beta subunit